MRLPWLVEFSAGLVLRRVLGRETPPPSRRSRPRRGPGSRSAAAPPPGRPAPSGRPRGPLVALMLGASGAGLVLMLAFEAWYTRVAGVAALFTFIVAGVFAIAGRDGLIAVEDE